jgi:hypothetical protein
MLLWSGPAMPYGALQIAPASADNNVLTNAVSGCHNRSKDMTASCSSDKRGGSMPDGVVIA